MAMPHAPLAATALALILAFAVRPAAADDAAEARRMIESQIEAFLADDAETAYSYASPGIREMFADPETFMAMVRRSYPPVYRPGNFAFGRVLPSEDGRRVFQEVLIGGTGGRDWRALYELEKQEDGTLRINGVRMVRASAPQT